MQTEVVITQIFILAIVVLIGVIAARLKVFTSDSKDVLSKVIFNISLPLMLFTNFFRLDATPRLIANSITILVLSGFVIFFLLLVGWVNVKVFRLKDSEAAVFKVHSMFGNTIFLGFPLITALYGVEGLLYASMFQLVSTIIMWTAGVIILSHSQGTSWKKSLSKVLNPNTIATITGLTPEKLVTSVIILEASMPCMVTVVIMAKEFGSDDRLAVGNVFVSTIISILTLPLVVMALEKVITF